MTRVSEAPQALPERRCVVLILDGLGDLPVESLGGKTPLEAAMTPRLDRLAAAGYYGLVDPVAPGVVPNTHTGVGLVFGLRPEQRALLKRGPVEAAGAGVQLQAGDIAFRANFATLEERADGLYVTDRRAGRVTQDSALFAEVLRELDLGDGVTARFHPTDQHRGALVFSGPGLEGSLANTDPGDGPMPARIEPCRAKESGSFFAASKVDRFVREAHERLRDHPQNAVRLAEGKLPVTGVITRGAGAWFELDSVLDEKNIGAALVVGCNTVAGLARIFGMSTVRSAAFTAGVDTDVNAKMEAAREALRHHSLVYVHIKAPDLFSHDFKPSGKKAFIERVDRSMDILEGSGAAIALTADHSTSSNSGAHTADPVPALFHVPGQASPRGGVPVDFGESACRDGSMPRQSGHEFLLKIIAYLGA